MKNNGNNYDDKMLEEKVRKILKEELNSNKKVDEEKIQSILENENRIIDKAKKSKDQKFFEGVKILIAILKDWWNGKFHLSKRHIFLIIIALLYVLNPLDIVPDYLPFVGYIDDAMVVGLILKWLHDIIEKYKNWVVTNK